MIDSKEKKKEVGRRVFESGQSANGRGLNMSGLGD